MKNALYREYAETSAIGYFTMSNYGGLEILDINYGIEDVAIACFNFGTGRQQIRRHKIYTAPSGRFYIRKAGTRYYFDQIMRAQ